MTDVELLHQPRTGSDQAFADLVRRHIGWVYGVARRRLHDAHLADDATQAVFILLHRKAPRFAAEGAMVRWLHRTAWYVSTVAARNERARRRREQASAVAAMQIAERTEPSSDWQTLAPLLDDLVASLNRTDREALLLRYYRDFTFNQIGEAMGINEEAARKRVSRAIEKLRTLAGQRGIAATSAALAGELAIQLRLPPPPGLAAVSTAAATAPKGAAVTPSTASLVRGARLMMAIRQIGIAAASTGIAAAVVGAGLILVPMVKSVAAATPTTAPTTVVASAPPAAAPAAPAAIRRLSPFTAVKWDHDDYQARVGATWYHVLAIDGQPIAAIVDFSHRQYRDLWQKRIDEDLVEVLTAMGRAPGNAVDLQLRDVDHGVPVVIQQVPLTEANRAAIWHQRNDAAVSPELTAAGQGYPRLSPFSAVVWQGEDYQVRVDQTWYTLLSINGHTTAAIIDFARKQYGDLWQKRIDEDLVQVLTEMDQPPGESVDLQLRTVKDAQLLELHAAPMTADNRRSILVHRQDHSSDVPVDAGGL